MVPLPERASPPKPATTNLSPVKESTIDSTLFVTARTEAANDSVTKEISAEGVSTQNLSALS
jgi:hypothetical protein